MAAKRLNVTPSTVSARISGLEEEIGQKLLHRNKSGAELTSPGFKFKRYAEVMLQLWGQARYEVSLPRGFEGVCNVGLDFDLWPGVGQRFLEHLRRHAPGIAVALWPGEQRMIDRWLEIGLVDIAFCHAPPAGERFTSRVLFDDELVMVSTRKASGAGPLGRLCLCRSRRRLPPPACRRLPWRCDIGAHHRILRLGPGPPPAQWRLGLPATAPCHGCHPRWPTSSCRGGPGPVPPRLSRGDGADGEGLALVRGRRCSIRTVKRRPARKCLVYEPRCNRYRIDERREGTRAPGQDR